MHTISVFIDASNLHHAQKANGWRIQFQKLKTWLAKRGKIVGLYYFTPSPYFKETKAVEGYRKFKKMLILSGYTVIDRELKKIRSKDSNGKTVIKDKANLDAEMITYMLNTFSEYNEMICMGGDGDFASVLRIAQEKGKYITCISNRNNTAIEIQNIANEFIDLKTLKKELSQ